MFHLVMLTVKTIIEETKLAYSNIVLFLTRLRTVSGKCLFSWKQRHVSFNSSFQAGAYEGLLVTNQSAGDFVTNLDQSCSKQKVFHMVMLNDTESILRPVHIQK